MSVPTALEQYLLELINRDRADPSAAARRHGLSPSDVPSTALEPLVINEDLLDAARAHSSWMERTDTFSHTGSGGSSPGDRARAEGWQGLGVGENIAGWFTFGSPNSNDQAIIDERHHALMTSTGHRANLMNSGYSEVGAGIAIGDWAEPGVTYDHAVLLTEDFSDRGRNYVTGVAFADHDTDLFYDPGEGLGGIAVKASGAAGTFTTTTWASGGYELAVPDGSYTVTFSGGALGTSAVAKHADIHGGNVKVDLDTAVDHPTTPTDPKPVTLNGSDNADTLNGGDGADTLNGNGGNDVLHGGAGNDLLRGGAGNDLLDGGTGADTMRGGVGNDVLHGGLGADILTGGSGRDRFDYDGLAEGGSGEHIRDFQKGAGGDTLDFHDLFQSIGYAGSNPVGDGYLRFHATGTGTQVDIDADGHGAKATFVPIVHLDNVLVASADVVHVVA